MVKSITPAEKLSPEQMQEMLSFDPLDCAEDHFGRKRCRR